jgi:hypothetical protein
VSLEPEKNLFLWCIKAHGIHRRDFPDLLAGEECVGAVKVRCRSPEETDRWVRKFVGFVKDA